MAEEQKPSLDTQIVLVLCAAGIEREVLERIVNDPETAKLVVRAITRALCPPPVEKPTFEPSTPPSFFW